MWRNHDRNRLSEVGKYLKRGICKVINSPLSPMPDEISFGISLGSSSIKAVYRLEERTEKWCKCEVESKQPKPRLWCGKLGDKQICINLDRICGKVKGHFR
jgi:hypothetical protein